jgi:4-hydroxyphenylpyruvate dioxygenase-like putative hemolysin
VSDAPEALQAMAPKPAEQKKPAVSLSEMLWVVNDEAERLENAQAARASAGEEPIPEMVRRAETFRALASFLAFNVEPYKEEIKALITRLRRGKR